MHCLGQQPVSIGVTLQAGILLTVRDTDNGVFQGILTLCGVFKKIKLLVKPLDSNKRKKDCPPCVICMGLS